MRKNDIDEIDIKILNILQKDSSITNKNLSEYIGLSPPPTLERVRKLVEKKIIQAYIAIINKQYFGFIQSALVFVTILKTSESKFLQTISELRTITDCYKVEPGINYGIKYFFIIHGKHDTMLTSVVKNLLNGVGEIIDYQVYDLGKPIKKTELEISIKDVK